MKDTTKKFLLGVAAGAAAGAAVGIALSDSETMKSVKDMLSEAGDQLNLKLQGMIDDSRDYLGDLKDKIAESNEPEVGVEHTEG